MKPSGDRLLNRNFSLILAGRGASILSSSLYAVVLVLYVKRLTGSASIIGAVELLAFLPMVLLGPFAGALVDRTRLKTVIVTGYALRGVLMLLLFLFSATCFLELASIDFGIAHLEFTPAFPFPLYLLFGVTLCLGCIESAFNSAMYAVVPTILEPARIQQGNSLMQGVGGALTMVGNALGGLFFSIFGAAPAFLLDGCSNLAAAAAGLFLSEGAGGAEARRPSDGNHFMGEVKEGFVFILANKGLRNQTIVYSLSNLLFPVLMLALPFLVQEVLKLGDAYYGYLMSVLTFSSIAGYFGYGWFKTTDEQNYRVICAIFVIEALLFLALSLTTKVYLVFGLLALLSICMAVSRLINTSIKQKVIPRQFRGRVFGTLDSINGGLVPLSLALGGVAIDLLDKNIRLIFFGIFVFYALLAGAFILDRSIKGFYLSSPSI
ncbi:MAG: MFS transporter [Desulfobacterales bacterium]|nr:MFS transporter [Desulfobacterales bacterium]